MHLPGDMPIRLLTLFNLFGSAFSFRVKRAFREMGFIPKRFRG